MPPLAKILLFLATLLPWTLHGEQPGIEINSEGGFSLSTASRNIRWQGPNTVTFNDWKITTKGNIEAYFDRVLIKEEDYRLRPKLRSAVITTTTTLHQGKQHILTAPHLIWLESKKILRASGLGILFFDIHKGWLKSTHPDSSIEITLSGESTTRGRWLPTSRLPAETQEENLGAVKR